MASTPTARLSQIKCELCDLNNILWKCLTCQEMMCDQCKKSHLKSKIARDHKVKLLDGPKTLQIGVIKDSMKCIAHISEDVQMFCAQCEELVCTECIVSGMHQNHTFSKVQDVVKFKLEELSKITSTLKQTYSTFVYSISAIKGQQSEYAKDISQLISSIKTRNVQMKARLDEITNQLIKQVKQIELENQEKMKEAELKLREALSRLKILIKDCETKDKSRNIELIRFVLGVKQTLDRFKSCIAPDPIHPPIFVSVDTKKLEALFGYLDIEEEKGSDFDKTLMTNISAKTKIKAEFTFQNANIVAAISDTEAWLGCWGRSDVTLVSKSGQILKTVHTDFDMYDLAVLPSGVLLATVCEGDRVKKITPDGISEDLYVAPCKYQTRGLAVIDDNDIIVCLYNSYNGEGCLVHLLSNGQQIQTLQYDTDGKTPLFSFPWNVSGNKNGDLIVTQRGGLVVVDKIGNKKFTYTGDLESLKSRISPGYTVTDKTGNILVSDHVNSVVHLLDKDGQFQKFILTEKNGLQEPRGLSIDPNGRLWVCSRGNDKVLVTEYT